MSGLRPLFPAIRLAVGCLILAIGLRTWLVMGLIEPVRVAGSSMTPTLEDGDSLWIDRTAFHWRLPRRGEMVVTRNPTDGQQLCVKRIIGLPYEVVSIADGQVLIDGVAVSGNPSPFVRDRRSTGQLPWRVPHWQLGPDEYFLLGDNPAVSVDSRLWGPVSARLLLGKPLFLDR